MLADHCVPHRIDWAGIRAQSRGKSKYNALFDFKCQANGQDCNMTMTSVRGHLMELVFDPRYQKWSSCNPKALFTAPLMRQLGNGMEELGQVRLSAMVVPSLVVC